MDRKKDTLSNYLSKKNLNFHFEKKILTQIFPLFNILYNQKFVHSDIHFENILLDEKNNLYLIDFGLVMHRDFCSDLNQKILYDVYLWAKEDHFCLLKTLLFFRKEHLLVKDNNYKKHRKKWIEYFQKHPIEWTKFKKYLYTQFSLHQKEDYKLCFDHFINNILTNSNTLSPKTEIYLYNVLTKIFLERMFLLFSLLYTNLVSIERKNFYLMFIQKNIADK
jgi:serine/threonine protein kinase